MKPVFLDTGYMIALEAIDDQDLRLLAAGESALALKNKPPPKG